MLSTDELEQQLEKDDPHSSILIAMLAILSAGQRLYDADTCRDSLYIIKTAYDLLEMLHVRYHEATDTKHAS